MRLYYPVVFGVLGLSLSAALAAPPDRPITVRADLTGFQEVPSKLTAGKGTVTATISADRNTISYELTFSGLTTPAMMAHFHLGQPGVAGGVFAFLCGGGGKPECPAGGGTVSGTIVAADILTPSPDRGITAGSREDAIRILLSGYAYANVHTTRFPSGEIRGQVRAFPFFPGRD